MRKLITTIFIFVSVFVYPDLSGDIGYASFLAQSGKYDSAMKYLKSLLKRSKSTEDTYNIYLSLTEIGFEYYYASHGLNADEIISLAQKTLSIKTNATTLKYMGQAYYIKGDSKNSIYYLSKSYRLKKDISIAFAIAAYHFAQKEYLNSLIYYNDIIREDSLNYRAYQGCGEVYIKINDVKSAISAYENAQKINPNDSFINLTLALLYKHNLRFSKSAKYYKKVIDISSKKSSDIYREYIVSSFLAGKDTTKMINYYLATFTKPSKYITLIKMVNSRKVKMAINVLKRSFKDKRDIVFKSYAFYRLAKIIYKDAIDSNDKYNIQEARESLIKSLIALIFIYYKGDNLYKALEFAKEAFKLEQSQEIAYTIVGIYEKLGMYKKAIDLLNKYKSASIDYIVKYATLNSKIGEIDKAISLLQSAYKETGNTKLLLYASIILFDEGKYDMALKFINKAISLNPEDANLHFYSGIMFDELNNYDMAIQSLKKAIKINKEFYEAYNMLGYIYAKRSINLNKAKKLVEYALSYKPYSPAFIDSLGWIYYKMGDIENAYINLRKADALISFRTNKDSSLAIIYEHLGDITKAKSPDEANFYYERAIMLCPPKNKKMYARLKEKTKK